ncbi:hypothetical protein BJ742DRAFT_795100 [Cladochytrium replicatum]|nr:hypothetical protein BJ742DRAFT_795100 [Cladochytrium replicatum]
MSRDSFMATDSWQTEYQRQFTWKDPNHPAFLGYYQQQQQKQSKNNQEPVQNALINLPYKAPQTESLRLADATAQTSPVDPGDQEKIQDEDNFKNDELAEEKPNALDRENPQTGRKESNREVRWADSRRSHRPHPEEEVESRAIDAGRTPAILPYGGKNVTPVIDGHYMKTFNVKVPPSEIYPTTRDRLARIAGSSTPLSESTHLGQAASPPKPVTTEVPPSASSIDPLKNYLRARQLVEQLQSRYQTEYQREFINWREKFTVPSSKERLDSSGIGGVLGVKLGGERPPERRSGKGEREPNLETNASQTISGLRSRPAQTQQKQRELRTPESSTKPQRSRGDLGAQAMSTTEGTQTVQQPPNYSNLMDTDKVSNSDVSVGQQLPDGSIIVPTSIAARLPRAGVSTTSSDIAEVGRRHYARAYEMDELQLQRDSNIQAVEEVRGSIRPERLLPAKESVSRPLLSGERVVRYAVDPPSTYHLAAELLRRSKRGANVDRSGARRGGWREGSY